MTRALLLAQPLLTALVVALSLLVVGVPHRLATARVYGGATDRDTLALRVEASRSDGTSSAPLAGRTLTVSASRSGSVPTRATCTLDDGGVCEVALALGHAASGPLSLSVDDGTRFGLARGAIELPSREWLAGAQHRGGWILGHSESGAPRLQVAAARGTFAVPFADTLLIAVLREGQSLPDVALSVSAEGARVLGKSELVTDARGHARVQLEPSDHNPSVHVEARTKDGARAMIDTALPVLAGALFVSRDAEGLRVASPIERSRAYYSVLTVGEGDADGLPGADGSRVADGLRVAGGVVALTPDGRGGSVGRVTLPTLPPSAWLQLSSELDEHSAALVGWPLSDSSEPQNTFDLPVRSLLDGAPAAFAREAARQSRVRWLTASFALLSLVLSLVLVLLRIRAADREIATHLAADLDPETARRVAPRAPLRVLAALLGIGLGFVALALFALAKF